MTIEKMIKTNEIRIISGEGEIGSSELYHGKRSIRAIKMRLTKERCHGDRCAKAVVFIHNSDLGMVFQDIENGDLCHQKPLTGNAAGRPSVLLDGKRINVYLDEPSLTKAAALGDGNVSAGIRLSLASCNK